jgi:mono/diheme cytochrome c family protein
MARFDAFKNFYFTGVIGMRERDNNTRLRVARAFGILAIFALLAVAGGRVAADDAPKPWVVPDDARKVKNPVPATPENLTAAAQLFQDNCLLCHGEKGIGDGPGAKTIKVKPANFTDAKLMSAETDGSLFWKMSQGRGPMPSWKDDLTDTERWQLVNYIRKLGKDAAK